MDAGYPLPLSRRKKEIEPRKAPIAVMAAKTTRLRTHYPSQNMTVAAMQMAEKQVWAHRS